ncbi:hypothetical protein [Coleofasciculus sp.]
MHLTIAQLISIQAIVVSSQGDILLYRVSGSSLTEDREKQT